MKAADTIVLPGKVQILGGTPGNGKVLTSDANGLGTWQTPSGLSGLTATQVLFATGASTVGGNAGFTFDNTNTKLTIDKSSNLTEVLFSIRNSNTGNAAQTGFYVHNDSGNSNTDGLGIFMTGSNFVSAAYQNSALFWNYENGPVVFGTNGTEKARITPAGNLGLGTLTPDLSSLGTGYKTLSIRGNATTGLAGSGVLELTTQLPDADGAELGYVFFVDPNSSNRAGGMGFVLDGTTANNRGSKFSLFVRANNGSISERFRISQDNLIFFSGLNDSTGVAKMVTVNNGVLAYQSIPSGGGSYTFPATVTESGGAVQLVNDNASPGLSRYYGTSGAGTKGWRDFNADVRGLLSGTNGITYNSSNGQISQDIRFMKYHLYGSWSASVLDDLTGTVPVSVGEAGYFKIHITVAKAANDGTYSLEIRLPFRKIVSNAITFGTRTDLWDESEGTVTPPVFSFSFDGSGNFLIFITTSNSDGIQVDAVVEKYLSVWAS